MRLFKRTKYFRINQIYAVLIFATVFTILFIVFYFIARFRMKTRHIKLVNSQLVEVNNVIDAYYRRDKLILNLTMGITEDMFQNDILLEERSKQIVEYDVTDPYSKQKMKVPIREWFVNNISILNNFTLVDKIAKLTHADISIYQKTDKAYVNISTSIQSLNKERMLGDMILNNSNIVATIEQDNVYIGRQLIDNYWYQVGYKPLYIDGKIQGLYYIRVKEKTGTELKKIYKEWSKSQNQIQFLITQNGSILAHPNIKQGTDFTNSYIYQHIKQINRDEGNFEFFDKKDNQKWAVQYLFNEITKNYVCIMYPSSYPFIFLDRMLVFALLITSFSALFLLFLFRISNKPIKTGLHKIGLGLQSLVENKEILEEDLPNEPNFKKLSDTIRILSKKQLDLAIFAKELVADNYEHAYPDSLTNDEVGQSLNVLNKKLQNTLYNENLRKKEEELKEWESERVTSFFNILQKDIDNLSDLAYLLISKIVPDLDADIGAVFFVNNENPDNVYFEQLATYAYEQRKFIDNKIYNEDGYVGRVANEKQTIFITEIPEDYIKIASGLGNSSPRCLLIVPLLINDELYGAIELASFRIFEDYQIKFLEKMADTIVSTMNNVAVNSRTKKLLEESRKRADDLSIEEDAMRIRLKELEDKEQQLSSNLYANENVSNSIADNVLVAEIDETGKIVFVNDLLCVFMQLNNTDIIGSHYEDFDKYISEKEKLKLKELWISVELGHKEQEIIEIKSGDNKMEKILVSLSPISSADSVYNGVIALGMVLKSN